MTTAKHRVVPYDAAAEEAVIGCCLVYPRRVDDVRRLLLASDFYLPQWARAWTAITELHDTGSSIDQLLVAAYVQTMGFDSPSQGDLVAAMADAPTASNLTEYVGVILRHGASRSALETSSRLTDDLYQGVDPYQSVEAARSALGTLRRVSGGRPPRLSTLDELLTEDVVESRWVIPDLLRSDERLVVVAPEGAGKSTLLRQLAVCAGQGIHPFRFEPTVPVRVLIVDAENSISVIRETANVMVRLGRLASSSTLYGYDPDRVHVLRRPEGLQLRTRHGLTELEDAIEITRPDVVFMGPLYQFAQRNRGERDDDFALDLIHTFNDLRVRYNFALVLEDHAPQGESGQPRKMRPFGSSVWMRWPDFGVGLPLRLKDQALVVDMFRGKRLKRDWPDEFVRGRAQEWPWMPVWKQRRAASGEPQREEETPYEEPF